MKKKSSFSTSCKQVIARIQSLFITKEKRKNTLEEKKPLRAHECYPLKLLPLSLCVLEKKLNFPRPQKPLNISTSATSSCTILPFPVVRGEEDSLRAKKVVLWKIKEHLFASRRLKSVRRLERSGKMPEITLLQEPDSSEEARKLQEELWQKQIFEREERHFHLTRVVKYLSD